MKTLKVVLFTLTLIVLAVAMLGSPARASEYDWKTTVTTTRPIEIPGQVLPAGTYVFKLLDVTGHRNVVQILNGDVSRFGPVLRDRDDQSHGSCLVWRTAADCTECLDRLVLFRPTGGLEFAYIGH